MAPKPHSNKRTFLEAPQLPLPVDLHPLVAAWIEQEQRDHAEAKERGWPERIRRVHSASGRRDLFIHDTLFKAAEARGCPAGALSPVWLTVAGECIGFKLYEAQRKCAVPLSKAELRDPLNIAADKTHKRELRATGLLTIVMKGDFQTDHLAVVLGCAASNGASEKQSVFFGLAKYK